jgi:hypothetical protein
MRFASAAHLQQPALQQQRKQTLGEQFIVPHRSKKIVQREEGKQ